MKRSAWIMAAATLAAGAAMATTVDFTAAEGYSGTGTVQLWADSLHAQNPTVGGWTETTWGSFAVDSSAGTVVVDGSRAFKSAIFDQALASNEVYTIGADFSFKRIENATLSGNMEFLSLDFTEVADASGHRIAMQMRRAGWNSAKYQLSFYENTGGANTYGSGAAVDETTLGFGVGDDQSDALWMGMTLVRGADASSWTATGVISNLTTGTEVSSYDVGTFDTSADFFTNSLYGKIGSLKADADSQVSDRLIDTFTVDAGAYVPPPPPPETVDFTAAEGYVPGDLVGQKLWLGHAASELLVDATTNDLVLPSTLEWKQATYNVPLTNSVRETGGVFRFNRTTNTIVSNPSLAGFGLMEGNSTGGGTVRVALQRRSSTSYRLTFAENSGGGSYSNSTVTISESALGFGESDSESDDLGLSIRLERGAATNDWTATMVLSNMTTSTLLDTFTMPAGSFATEESYFNGSLYGVVSSVNSEAVTFTSNRRVDRFFARGIPQGSPFEQWVSGYGLTGADAESGANPDGDRLTNLEEYGLGGNPDDAGDIGHVPTLGTFEEGGTNWFEYVHVSRTDPDSGIGYLVESCPDLVYGAWTNAGDFVVSSGSLDADFNTVTNRISMEGKAKEFIRLRMIEQ